jgi:hypothetical protein
MMAAQATMPQEYRKQFTDGFTELAGLVPALKRRVERLENSGFMHHAGHWEAGKSYVPGATVTYHGSLWTPKVASTSVRLTKVLGGNRLRSRTQR